STTLFRSARRSTIVVLLGANGGRCSCLAVSLAQTITLGNELDELTRQCELARPRELLVATVPIDGERIVVFIKAEVIAHFVGSDHVELLASELCQRILLDVLGFRSKADQERRRFTATDRCEHVGSACERQGERIAGLLDFFARHFAALVVRDSRCSDKNIGVAHLLLYHCHQLVGTLDVDSLDTDRRRNLHRTAHEDDSGTWL